MSATIVTIIGISFALIMGFTGWLKFQEHLQLHRHEHGDHTSRTDRRRSWYRLSDSGVMRRMRKDNGD